MKKFFFGSSGSSKANGNASSQLSRDKPSQSGLKNRVPENQSSASTPTLKKSRTYSSGTIHESGIGQMKFSFFNNRSGSPSRSETSQNLSDNRSTRCEICSFPFRYFYFYFVSDQPINIHICFHKNIS